jgi:hypothetical protein
MTPEEAVADYILRFRVLARAEMRAFEKEPTLHDAIRRAALCVWPNGKRHEHQYLIAKPLLEQAEGRLQAMARKLAHAADFAALHDLVEDEIGRLHGIGPLTIYDIAHRVGAYLKKAPKLVYLHSGTKIGAAVFGLRGRTIDPANLPSAFSRLTPAEIEDCLCIYRHELRKGHNTNELRVPAQ